jgi:hypothetical protein
MGGWGTCGTGGWEGAGEGADWREEYKAEAREKRAAGECSMLVMPVRHRREVEEEADEQEEGEEGASEGMFLE